MGEGAEVHGLVPESLPPHSSWLPVWFLCMPMAHLLWCLKGVHCVSGLSSKTTSSGSPATTQVLRCPSAGFNLSQVGLTEPHTSSSVYNCQNSLNSIKRVAFFGVRIIMILVLKEDAKQTPKPKHLDSHPCIAQGAPPPWAPSLPPLVMLLRGRGLPGVGVTEEGVMCAQG